jgi:hypothetical protein
MISIGGIRMVKKMLSKNMKAKILNLHMSSTMKYFLVRIHIQLKNRKTEAAI